MIKVIKKDGTTTEFDKSKMKYFIKFGKTDTLRMENLLMKIYIESQITVQLVKKKLKNFMIF